jgi:hypothetical protein
LDGSVGNLPGDKMKKIIILLTLIITTSAQANGFKIDGWSQVASHIFRADVTLAKGHKGWWLECRGFTNGAYHGANGKTYVREISGWNTVQIRLPKGNPKPTEIQCQLRYPS